MINLKDLKDLPESDPLWGFLKSDSLRARVFDLLLSCAMDTPAPAEKLTGDALRAYMARIDFVRDLDGSLPRSPEEANQTNEAPQPEPVE